MKAFEEEEGRISSKRELEEGGSRTRRTIALKEKDYELVNLSYIYRSRVE